MLGALVSFCRPRTLYGLGAVEGMDLVSLSARRPYVIPTRTVASPTEDQGYRGVSGRRRDEKTPEPSCVL